MFAPGRPFQPSLKSVAMVRSLSQRVPFQVGSELAGKQYTRLEKFARDTHSNVLQVFINYGRKMFYDIEHRGQCYKTFLVHNLQIFILSLSVCQTRFEKFARDKHSSLLQKSVNHDCKRFYNIEPWWQFYVANWDAISKDNFILLIQICECQSTNLTYRYLRHLCCSVLIQRGCRLFFQKRYRNKCY